MRVLVDHDDPRVAKVIAAGLSAEGFNVDVASDGFEGCRRAHEGAHASSCSTSSCRR
jgi:DNA-binding response OmpR family regulator